MKRNLSAGQRAAGRRLEEIERDTAEPEENATQPETGLPDFISAHDLCTAPEADYPEPQILIENLLAVGDLAILSGGSKSFKSWLALQLALCVGAGTPFLGRTTTKAKVLVTNFELKPISIRRRLKAIAGRLGVGMDNLLLWNLRNVTFGHGFLDVLALRIKAAGVGLVILDPLYSLLALSDTENAENSNPAMTALLGSVRLACEKAGAAALIVHHFAKGDSTQKSNLDRGAGAGALGRFPDAIMSLVPHQSAGAYVFEMDFRDFAPAEPFVIRWEKFLMVPDAGLDPSQKRVPPPANQKGRPEDICRFLTIKPTPREEVEEKVAKAFDCCPRTAQRKVQRAIELGFCMANRHGIFLKKTEEQTRF